MLEENGSLAVEAAPPSHAGAPETVATKDGNPAAEQEAQDASSVPTQSLQYAAATVTAAAASSRIAPGRRIIPTVIEDDIRFVPLHFQHCEMGDVLALVAAMLDRLIRHNDTLSDSRPLTRFHSKAAPAITPLAYLTRITTFINVDPCILVILLFYIDKLSSYLTITSLTVHRFLISAVCCGSKALSDSFATNSRYAKVGGVELVEMNTLEREFLVAIGWRLATSGVMLEQYWRSLVQAEPGYELARPEHASEANILYNSSDMARAVKKSRP